MNQDLSIRPAYLSGAHIPDDAFADQIGFATPPRISMDGDKFNVLDENGDHVLPLTQTAVNIDVIMLWENDSRIYYPKDSYDRNNVTPPACYSDNLVTPSVGALQPQSELCANCPRAVRDQPSFSGTTLVSLCKEEYKVAVLVAGAGGRVFLLRVTPGSRKAYQQYRRYLRSHNARPADVITKLSYADKAMSFEFTGWVTEKAMEFVARTLATDEPAMVVNAFDKPKTLGLPKPAETTSTLQPVPQQPAEFVPQAAQAQPAAPPTERRPRGRPPREATPPVSPAASPTPAPSAVSGPAKSNGGGFGMETPQTPPSDMQAALDRAFGPR